MTVLCWMSKKGAATHRVLYEKSSFGSGEGELRSGGEPLLVVFIVIRCGDQKLVCVFLCVCVLCVCSGGGGYLCVCVYVCARCCGTDQLRFKICTIKKAHAPSAPTNEV